MTTRGSIARLAKSKASKVRPRKPQPVVEDVDPATDSDFERAESECGSEDDEVRPPARKRQRTTRKATKAKVPARKKQVRGKQGRLAGLMSVPVDIFAEIASHLLPVDIISLARANKFFRGLLMNRSSSHIWHSAMRNVSGLPPCPPDLSVPHYLALLFSKYCSVCGGPARCRMDEILQVRLCVSCRQVNVVPLSDLLSDIFSLVHSSSKIVTSKRRWGWDPHVLRSEADAVLARLLELRDSGDEDALKAWKDERSRAVLERREQAQELVRFLDSLDADRELELRKMKNDRRKEIERRLLELGWEQADMQFSFYSPLRRDWYSLVEQAKVLTDRIWVNLRPKLIPFLESNREARLKKEQLGRQQVRRDRLGKLLAKIQSDAAPLIQLTVLPHTNPSSSSTSSGNTTAVSHSGVFPDLADALEWPVVKELYENDTDADQMEARFEERRAEINTHIAEWQLNVQNHMADLIRESRESDDTEGEVLKPTLVVTENDADPFAGLSENVKLLLRADSLFHNTGRASTNGPPLVYDAAVRSGYTYNCNISTAHSARPLRQSLDLTRLRVHVEAQHAARVLLEDMGRPDACYMELRSVGQQYICGRCHDNCPKTWEEMVHHYVEQERQWDRIQSDLPLLTKNGITFNNVHDPEAHTDRPLIKYLSLDQLNEELSTMGGSLRSCKLCLKAPITQDVRGPEGRILTHLLEVHGISEPKIREHYGDPSLFSIHGADLMDMFHDDMYDMYGSEFDSDGPYGGYDSDDYPWWW